jgi:hypothetical protein
MDDDNNYDGGGQFVDNIPEYDEPNFENDNNGGRITKTTTNAVFPAWNVDQHNKPLRYMPIPTARTMKDTVLFGIPLRSSLTGQEVSNDAIESFIKQAISAIEHEFDMYITPVTFIENQDYSRAMNFWSFGYVKLNHSPILTVRQFQLTFNNGISGLPPLVNIPLEYIYVQPQEGTVQLVPAMGVSISGLIVSIYSGLGFHAFNSQMLNYWPGAVRIEYDAGFELNKVPAMVVSLIENLAAYYLLSAMGPVLFAYNSVSIGIDGTSQSVGTLGPAYLQNRLADLEKIIAQQKDAMRGYYQKKFIIDAL